MVPADRALPTVCTCTGQAGPRSSVGGPSPGPLQTLHSQFLIAEAFQGISLFLLLPFSESLSASPNILACYVWTPSWRT